METPINIRIHNSRRSTKLASRRLRWISKWKKLTKILWRRWKLLMKRRRISRSALEAQRSHSDKLPAKLRSRQMREGTPVAKSLNRISSLQWIMVVRQQIWITIYKTEQRPIRKVALSPARTNATWSCSRSPTRVWLESKGPPVGKRIRPTHLSSKGRRWTRTRPPSPYSNKTKRTSKEGSWPPRSDPRASAARKWTKGTRASTRAITFSKALSKTTGRPISN